MKRLLKASLQPIPLRRLAIVASSGLIAFLSLMQGVLTLTGNPSCYGSQVSANYELVLIQFSIAVIAYGVFLLGALRLRHNWEAGKAAYFATVFALLISGGILSALFLGMSSCAL
jgi:hypothetical protein